MRFVIVGTKHCEGHPDDGKLLVRVFKNGQTSDSSKIILSRYLGRFYGASDEWMKKNMKQTYTSKTEDITVCERHGISWMCSSISE